MNHILEVNHLTKVFKKDGKTAFTAVDDVSFFLEEGEVLGIVGESGSGKSTLVNMITRLIEPSSGTITFLNQEITKSAGKELQRVYQNMQMVFQLPQESFNPKHTLGDGVAESLCNGGMAKRKALEKAGLLFEKCGLDKSFAKRYPHEVSGGQCQRAAIARALAVEPQLIICDEATSALDVTVQKQIMELLSELKKEQKISFLFICHDLALVQQFCDRVIVLHHGKIVEQGNCEMIIKNPQTEYVKKLIQSVL